MSLAADCGRCVGLCCVAPAFVASADFAFSKPAGVACRHLDADARCSIHDRLIPSGFPGCVAYDCFGAGQRTVALFSRPDGGGPDDGGPDGGGPDGRGPGGGRPDGGSGPDGGGGGPGGGRSARMLRTYEVVRQLHELLWYLTDALSRPAAAPVHGALAAARVSIDAAIDAGPDALDSTDPAAHRAAVAPLLRRASTLVRTAPPDPADRNVAGRDLAGRSVAGRDRAARDPGGRDLAGRERAGRDLAGRDLAGRDLAGRDLAGADLWRADLSTASLIGADLRDADLRSADLLGADLRGARLAGADLTGALYLTRTQVGGAQGSPGTRLPDRLPPPAHWR